MTQQVFTSYEQEDRKLIQREYRKLLRCINNPNEEDKKNIRLAYEIAVEAHQKQRRKSGEPYILHPIEVARICAEEIGLGPTAVVSALLHDVVEDTDVTLDEIHERFGDKITMIVGGLTKLDNLFDVESPQAENFKKVLRTLTKDVRVVLIKMADRLHNMRTLGSMPQHKQLKIASETAFIYAPLAHRLGLYNMKTEFQDLCMKIMDSENYQFVKQKLQQTKDDRNAYIKEFINPLVQDIDKLGYNYRIFGRPKSISSIWNKIQTKKVPFEEIYDLFAVRIVLDVPREKEKRECWNIYSIVTDHYQPIPERLKDWVSIPKANGYESLHTTVVGPKGRFVEVQIRTVRMDAIAERGFAAHWKYKGGNADSVFDTWINGLREILESPENDAVQFINDFKTNLFAEEVYVFTPKGDMKMFPKGATALDFAFDIHTEVGYHCTSAKVNKKLVPLSYVLRNGDQISVTTNKTQKPNESWLNMVVTGKARSKIRQALKEEKRKIGELGKEALVRKFNSLKANFDDHNIELLVKYLSLPSRVDLFYNIAQNKSVMNCLSDFEVDKIGRLVEKVTQEEVEVVEQPTSVKKYTGTPKLLIDGENAANFTYSLAACCNPVQGDDIFGFVTTSEGVKIHRNTCPNATHLLSHYGYRVLKAEWVNTFNTSFIADLRITGVDTRGVVQKLTDIITNVLRLDMRSISMDGNEGYYEGRISIVVLNTDQLQFVIKTLKNVDGVYSVTRVN